MTGSMLEDDPAPEFTPEDAKQIVRLKTFVLAVAAAILVSVAATAPLWLTGIIRQTRETTKLTAATIQPATEVAGTFSLTHVDGPLFVQQNTANGALRICIIVSDSTSSPIVRCF